MRSGQEQAADNQEGPAPGSSISPPTISLPKGGGAMRGIGEKFQANAVTGTASLSVPIFTTPGRAEFHPQLSLAYDSGSGNGPFGFGWHLSVPSISRKTEKALPQYRDALDSDTFLLSGAEDLVPAVVAVPGTATWMRDTREEEQGPYAIQRYRPRIEGPFVRIERWRHGQTGEVHWRSISRDNITTLYGRSSNSRIVDPQDPTRVFSWLIEESSDDKGNIITYEYKQENGDGIDRGAAHEAHHLGEGAGFANRYLKRIRYGNAAPDDRTTWLFEVVFDYGEHDEETPTVDETRAWPARPDAFSSFRSGFEIRTYRLCRRVLMFHRFRELGTDPCLVRSTDFGYTEGPVASFLRSVTQVGYERQADASTYARSSLPPLQFSYSEPRVDPELHAVDRQSLENLPVGIDGATYRWLDLDSEGLAGVLTEQAGAWFYKRNLGEARFAPAELVAGKPSLGRLADGGQQLMDLAGNGHMYLVQYTGAVPGFQRRAEDASWGPWTAFASLPTFALDDPNLRYIDLNGDGRPDLLLSEDEVFRCHLSLGEQGFAPDEVVPKPRNEEQGPALVFADANHSVYLADMTGDGLTDIVRIRNGEVCYWPNLGYGRFGPKVTMDQSPVFDRPDRFDQKRIRLADIDGSGTTDLLYVGAEGGLRFWFNQAGNSWSAPQRLETFPTVDDLTSVSTLDLLGNGTACVVWSSSLARDADRPMRYIDLMGGQKPHQLVSVTNNLGNEVRVGYAASTKFYLDDLKAGTPWITRLPFSVQVVERVETRDLVASTKLVTRYAYHHGYYDPTEREFRGFGQVEQWDTEAFDAFVGAGLFSTGPEGADEALHVPPAYTRSWFHTGLYQGREVVSKHFANEYYRGDPDQQWPPDTFLPGGLTAAEEQEACRALKGQLLRQEVYGLDDSPLAPHPYRVTEHRHALRRVQPFEGNPHAVFYVYPLETLECHYERQSQDPRVGHQLTLEVDEFGNVTRSASVAYARRPDRSPQPEQARVLTTCSERAFANLADQPHWYRVGVPVESRTYELTGLPAPARDAGVYELAAVRDAFSGAADIAYEAAPTPGTPQRRLISRRQTFYYADDLSGSLPLGKIGRRALPHETCTLALTPGLLKQVFGDRVTDAMLRDEGKYRLIDGGWWVPSSRPVFDPGHFYRPVRFLDPFGGATRLTYDSYALLVTRSEDPLGNEILATPSYRTLLPERVRDPNENWSAVRFDPLSRVVATAVMGKQGQADGDTLEDPTTRHRYELFRWLRDGRPNRVYAAARERHGDPNTRWQESYSYSDGSGREIMRKVQAEPGQAPTRGPDGEVVRDGQGRLVLAPTASRWVGTGRTVVDNKGNPVKKYEPFFSSTPEFEDEADLVQWGVTPILHYDPLGRLVRTDQPNGTFSSVEFDAWRQVTWDENDTVLQSPWYAARQALDPTNPATGPERRAAELAAKHANTPRVDHQDGLGRAFLSVADNGSAGKYPIRLELDIQGNQRAVIDARGNRALEQQFDLRKQKLHTRSADAGERWLLSHVADKPARTWDSRGYEVWTTYDVLIRPTHLSVRRGTGAAVLAERRLFGEAHPDGVAGNLRGRLYQQFDGAGVATSERYDFKGNLLHGTRQLAREYRKMVDWSALASLTDPQGILAAAMPALEAETFATERAYDALNRPTSLTTPDQSETRFTYNEASLLERLEARLHGAAEWTAFVSNIDYNARGQRELIEYGNGTRTEYTYEDRTFRLRRLSSRRSADQALLQDLLHTYDPVGNVVQVQDGAQQTIFFGNAVVPPGARYEYDALYWLRRAEGREHAGQNADRQPDHTDLPVMDFPNPNDGQAMRNYTEQYEYDPVGNILAMIHEVGHGPGNWARRYDYQADSNRLRGTSLPGDPVGMFSAQYGYDAAGNMAAMPHLAAVDWDFQNRLHRADLGGGGTGYSVYDSNGKRVRKVIERLGSVTDEQIYLDRYEVFRRYNGSGLASERQTLDLSDDTKRVVLIETNTIESAESLVSPVSIMRYQLDNHIGSVSLETNGVGALISFEEYYAYGGTSYHATNRTVSVNPKRYRYSAKERDEETSFYYYETRYYAPWLARWISCDPGGLVDGPSLYRYSRNNPVNLTDKSGLYAHAGHYYTVYAAAVAAGFSPEVAYRTAFFAQMPDQVAELDAKSTALAWIAAESRRFRAEREERPLTASERADMKRTWEHAQVVERGLHSLTGSLAVEEQERRVAAIRRSKPGTPEEGMAGHAFGDASYPHQDPKTDPRRMFPAPFGHGLRGTAPDEIATNELAWEGYFEDLVKLFAGQASGDPKRVNWFRIHDLERRMSRAKDEAEQIQVLKGFIEGTLTERGFKPELAPYRPEEEGGPVPWTQFQMKHPEETKGLTLEGLLDIVRRSAGQIPPRPKHLD